MDIKLLRLKCLSEALLSLSSLEPTLRLKEKLFLDFYKGCLFISGFGNPSIAICQLTALSKSLTFLRLILIGAQPFDCQLSSKKSGKPTDG